MAYLPVVLNAGTVKCVVKTPKFYLFNEEVSSQKDCFELIQKKLAWEGYEYPYEFTTEMSDGSNLLFSHTSDLGWYLDDFLNREVPSEELAFKHGYTLAGCEDHTQYGHTVKSKNGEITPECSPEILYSWGKMYKAQDFVEKVKSAKVWGDQLLYTSRTPISTFEYGNTLLRVKLKPKVKILYLNLGKGFGNSDEWNKLILRCKNENVVLATQYERTPSKFLPYTMVDYIICNPKVIDSISYGQYETALEAAREYRWIKTHGPKDYDLWWKFILPDLLHAEDNLYRGEPESEKDFCPDGKKCQLINLQANIMYQFLLKEDGDADFYSSTGSSLEEHFKTKYPNYFNH